MALINQVLVEFAPKITPTKIEFIDGESKAADQKTVDPSGKGYISQAGKAYPMIQINDMVIGAEELINFTILQNEFLPSIRLSFYDMDMGFTSYQFPINKPIISVFVAPSNGKLKSISGDFLITDIRSFVVNPTVIRYDLTAELYIPKLYTNTSIAYRNMTSVEALRKIASDLGLGFATNEDSTDDQMTWINPNLNYKTFIQQIVARSYKNEKSFYTCFIDRNYILNFVNVEKQFARDNEVDVTYFGYDKTLFDAKRFDSDKKEDEEIIQVPMVLTNSTGGGKNDMSIEEFSLISENGDILKNESFRKKIHWYSHGESELSFFTEPISNLTTENGSVHQRPALEDFTNGEIVKWVGVDYLNNHRNYKFARLLNSHNSKELDKNLLRVILHGPNFSIPRGSRVKVEIVRETVLDVIGSGYDADPEVLPKNPEDVQTIPSTVNQNIDPRLTDFYYVKDIIHRFKMGANEDLPYSTEMILSRRNWQPLVGKLISTTNE
jgi:hypothetical protein